MLRAGRTGVLQLFRSRSVDTSGDARLDADELRALLKSAGLGALSKRDARRIVRELDRDGDGLLDVSEARACDHKTYVQYIVYHISYITAPPSRAEPRLKGGRHLEARHVVSSSTFHGSIPKLTSSEEQSDYLKKEHTSLFERSTELKIGLLMKILGNFRAQVVRVV